MNTGDKYPFTQNIVQTRNFVNNTELQTGIQLRVTEGYRSNERQDSLYAQGRTTPGSIVTYARGGESNHNSGRAMDVVIMGNGTPDWTPITPEIAQYGTREGFDWGGNWIQFRDMFNNLTNFGYERGAKEAVGFYLAYLLLIIVFGAFVGGIIGGIAGEMTEGIKNLIVKIVAFLTAIIVIMLSIVVVRSKKYGWKFADILVILISGVISIFGGGLLGLIGVAYLTTKASAGQDSSIPEGEPHYEEKKSEPDM